MLHDHQQHKYYQIAKSQNHPQHIIEPSIEGPIQCTRLPLTQDYAIQRLIFKETIYDSTLIS